MIPRFDPTINLGHIVIVISALTSVFIAYSNIVRAQDNHELRLDVVEKQQSEFSRTNREILAALTEIKTEISALKVQVERSN